MTPITRDGGSKCIVASINGRLSRHTPFPFYCLIVFIKILSSKSKDNLHIVHIINITALTNPTPNTPPTPIPTLIPTAAPLNGLVELPEPVVALVVATAGVSEVANGMLALVVTGLNVATVVVGTVVVGTVVVAKGVVLIPPPVALVGVPPTERLIGETLMPAAKHSELKSSITVWPCAITVASGIISTKQSTHSSMSCPFVFVHRQIASLHELSRSTTGVQIG